MAMKKKLSMKVIIHGASRDTYKFDENDNFIVGKEVCIFFN